MSRLLKISGKTLKFAIGSFQPLLSDTRTPEVLISSNILSSSQMSFDGTRIVADRLLDLGGTGDCFFLAVNAALTYYSRCFGNSYSFDPTKIYDLLSIPQYTYIEGEHISQFSGIYPFSIVVVREYEGECHFCQFGTKPDLIYLFNDYPRHYLLFDQILKNGEFSLLENLTMLRDTGDWEIKVEEVVSFPSVVKQEKDIFDDPASCLKEDLDLPYLYRYVDSRYSIRKDGYALTSTDSKVYYKLRHNLFKSIFLDLLGLNSTEEKPFTEYGVDSVRTPDMLIPLSGTMILLEFTVVKKFATSVKTKQSQNKYANEVVLLEEQGWHVKQFYPTLSLDEGTSSLALEMQEIASIIQKEIFDDVDTIFMQLQTELNVLEFNISELIPELLLNQEEYTKVMFKNRKLVVGPENFQVLIQKVGLRRQRDQNTYLLIRKNSRALERQLKLTRYNAKFLIIINKTYNRVYADVDTAGIQKNTLLSLLQNNSPEVVKHVKYVGSTVDTEEPFKVMGESDFKPSKDRSQLTRTTVDLSQYESYYKNKLVKGEMLKEMNTLVDSKLEMQAPKVKDKYLDALKTKREHEKTVIFDKKWFLFPIMTQAEYGKYDKLEMSTELPLTDRLLRNCIPVPFDKNIERNQDIESLDIHLKTVNEKYNNLLKFLSYNRVQARKIKNIYAELEIKAKLRDFGVDVDKGIVILNEYQKAKKLMVEKVGEPTRKTYRNRVSFTSTYMKNNWPKEMEHFNSVKGVIKTCQNRPLSDLKNSVTQLTTSLWQELPEPVKDNVISDTEPLALGLSKILDEMKDLANEILEPLKKTQIMHDLELLSRLAYTILYYSNIKSNKEDFFYDNLGYKNVIVFIKGGKKILSNKKSRLFKLIFPIKEGFSWLHSTPNSKIITYKEQLYCVWPWQTWSFPMLKKASELYYSFPNYFACSYLESGLDLVDYKKFMTAKVLNMYSQRRKVEIWFGFFRYLYLNSMATYTSVVDLIDDMVDHEYDPYFSYCQKLFAESYIDIYKNASEGRIYDMMTGLIVENFDLCAEKFDESLFMTMAPFDRVNEHLRNLRSVLKTHLEVTNKFSSDPLVLLGQTSVDISDDDYFKKLASDDLMFDPKLTFAVGSFAGEMISKVTTLTDMSSEFGKILSKSFSEISTSKGMRSSKGDFWGKKGHDVIFGDKTMIEIISNFMEAFPSSHSDYKKKLSECQISYREKIESLSEMQLEFDLKDKAQWKGSREIYVMSECTKILQSPLEKFFKYLCSWTPNEIIHKKSHVRPKFIHSQVFEFETGEDVNTYATLDCRKWAPKSNLWKYYYFVKGMSHHLPEEFVDYFETVWSLMFTKKVRIQAFYIDLLNKNPNTLDICKPLKKRKDGDYEFTMPYSFMMGIFNYLSSLLHAFSQLYFDNKIAKSFGASFNLIAHSDDSGGVIFSKSADLNYKLFAMYEMFQKGLNHLMSKKKCALSSNFFEMISIMYANKRLIPMTHKFLANVSFEPKGKGWVDDISTIVSKIVEIFSNGGTMLQCYITMLSMSEMIRKFYHLPRLKTLSKMPLAYGGLFNMHPIHMILLGADAQEILLDTIETPGERGFRVSVGNTLFGEYFPGKGVSANFHIPYYKQHNLTHKFNSEDTETLKLMSGVIPETTLGQIAGHYSRLKDPAYIYSLSGVDMCQIFVMTLFTRTLVLNASSTKKCDLRRLTLKYAVLKSLGLFASKTTKGFSNFQHYAKASENIKLSLKDMNVASKKTCKPLVYNTFQNIGLGLNFKTVNEIIAYRKSPKLHFLFPDKIRMETLVSWVKSNLQYSDDYILEDYLMKLSSKDLEKTRSSYCFIPSGISVDTVERFWTYINFYCTRRYYISSKKPQYFTIDQFKLWNADYESIKHMYLLVKVALRCPLNKEIFEKLKENANCSGCNYTQTIRNIVDEIFEIRNAPDSSYLVTDLPFAIYTQPQLRAVNVWYGRAEFVLYTKYGSVEVTKKLGQVHHIYNIVSFEVLDQLHFLLVNFLVTRGLPELDVVYTVNDSASLKLGFGDLKQPKIVYPGERSMMQTNGIINLRPVSTPKLYKDGNKFTLDGLTVDFEIYQNYDINEGFYKSHDLGKIKNLIFEEEKVVDLEDLKKTALSTKIYEVLQLDPSHASSGNIEKKYQPGFLLGSERSLTRALVLADKAGKSNYRSTSTPAVLDTSIFEGLSHKDIPILDLVENFSFSRVTYKERMVMDSIVNKGQLERNQVHILDGLVKKMGMKPIMNALTLTRVVFSDLIYNDVKNLAQDVATDYMLSMVKAAIQCITEKFSDDPKYYIQGNASQIYQQLALMVCAESSVDLAGELLTKLFMRAQKSSSGKFWEYRKDNLYASIIVPKVETFKNQCLFNQAILSKVGAERYKILGNIRQIHLGLKSINRNFEKILKKVKSRRKDGTEWLTANLRFEDMEKRNYFLNEDDDDFEDDADAVAGGDDPEGGEEREWDSDGDDVRSYVFNQIDFRCLGEDTLTQDLASVSVRSLVILPPIPWLGACNCEIITVNGVPMFETTYPGYLTRLPSTSTMKQKKISRREAKPIPVEEQEELKSWSGRSKVQTDIFSFDNEEDVYNYQVDVLKNIGVTDPENYSSNFFKLKEVSNEDYFWSHLFSGVNLKAHLQMDTVHKVTKRRSSVMPGFTGNLKDDDLRAELNAIFNGHAEEIVSGNQCLTMSSYKTILRSLKRLYRENLDRNIRAFIIILLATMKDCVITNSSDGWYLDALLGSIDALEEEKDSLDADDAPPPLPTRGLLRDYKIKSPYD